VGRHRRAIEFVREELEEASHRIAAVAIGVELHQRSDRLLADLRLAVGERGHDGGHRGEVAQLAQPAHHLETHLGVRVADEGGQRGDRLAPAAASQLGRRVASRARVGTLQVRDQVLEGRT
jgi:hypothetical protein